MEARPRILLIGMAPELGDRLSQELSARGCDCESVKAAGHGVARASWDPPAIVVLDERDDSGRTREVVEALLEISADLQVVGVGDRPAVDALVHLATTAGEPRTRTVPPPTQKRARVLVVDDDEDLRDVLRINLESSAFEVVEARDGVEALARLAEARPDVILLDLMMPRMSGENLLARLREASVDPPPVVIYTAYSAAEARLLGDVSTVLRKPAGLSEVIEALRSSIREGARET